MMEKATSVRSQEFCLGGWGGGGDSVILMEREHRRKQHVLRGLRYF